MVVANQSALVITAVVLFSIVLYGALGWVILLGFRWLKRRAVAAQERALDGLELYDQPSPGLVSVRFHTYYGFLVFFVQTEHRFWASPHDAQEALSRLHRFNLVWGMLAKGAPLIPLVSFGNYLAQRRSVRKQEAALAEEYGSN
jgi:hypothetical protein